MPVVEAAVRLAHLTHGPNMELIFLGARMNVAHLDTIPLPAFGWDRRVVRWAESYSDTGHRFDRVKDWDRHVFFIGGVQVDPFGNTNLIGVGSDYNHLRFRGPGSVGTPTLSTHVGRYYIVLTPTPLASSLNSATLLVHSAGVLAAQMRVKSSAFQAADRAIVSLPCVSSILPRTANACGCVQSIKE